MKQLRKILPCTLDNGQYDAYYALKAKDDLSKINVTARGSTMVTILIPLCKEDSKFLQFEKEDSELANIYTGQPSKIVRRCFRAYIKTLTDGTQTRDLLICHLYRRWNNLGEHGM